jgi:hypothetical protein
MTRAFLLLPLAALASGCYSSNPCYAGYLNVYWTPGPSPNAGFEVPGLVAAGFPSELGCAAAGVSGVQVFVGGLIAPCSGGAGFCVDANTWLCSTGGVSVAIGSGGTYAVQVDAYDANGNLKYTSGPVAASASNCGDSAVGIFSQGVDGTLDIPYAFADGGNACAGASNLWFQVTSGGAVYDFVDDTSPNPAAIACTDVLANRAIGVLTPAGGSLIPAGVYTRTRLEEVSQQVGGFVLQRTNCAVETVVHAGNDAWPTAALSASSTFCP